mgnify:CR=1 FL=1
MLSAFISSLRTPDLRRKILFTLGLVVLYRAGATLPSPGVNYHNVNQCIQQVMGSDSGQFYGLINLLVFCLFWPGLMWTLYLIAINQFYLLIIRK